MANIREMYTIVYNPTIPYNAIKLTEATPWSGFIYSYGKMEMLKENPDGTATLSFDYTVEVPGPVDNITTKSPEFNKLLGDILVDLLEEGYGQSTEKN